MGTPAASRETVAVAMSGGVDSSVAAALLCEQGYDVVGLTLRLWGCGLDEDQRLCCGVEAASRARAVAELLGIAHHVVSAEAAFAEQVLRPAWAEYARGRTPSPCVRCNDRIKLGELLEHALGLGASWIATGHYARVERAGSRATPRLLRGADPKKDQSYFLFSLSRPQLELLLLPIGRMTKPQVRDRARSLGLPTAATPESQDNCLGVDSAGFAEALRHRFGAPARPGAIVDPRGERLGVHEGVHLFTVGQRRGLGVSLGRRAYVCEIRGDSAEVVVTSDPTDLASSGLEASGVRWLVEPEPASPFECTAQIRYRHAPVRVLVRPAAGRASVAFERPQVAVAPGQAVVFYDAERVLGGGWIERATRP